MEIIINGTQPLIAYIGPTITLVRTDTEIQAKIEARFCQTRSLKLIGSSDNQTFTVRNVTIAHQCERTDVLSIVSSVQPPVTTTTTTSAPTGTTTSIPTTSIPTTTTTTAGSSSGTTTASSSTTTTTAPGPSTTPTPSGSGPTPTPTTVSEATELADLLNQVIGLRQKNVSQDSELWIWKVVSICAIVIAFTTLLIVLVIPRM